MTNINNLKKKNQRLTLSIKRKYLKIKNNTAHKKLTTQLLKISKFKKAKIVASFISIKTEISMDDLNQYLYKSKKIFCLPVMRKNFNYLIFRKFDKNTILKKNKFGILEPNEKSDELKPDFILTPCLAFDQYGYRIGYGGGYYDQTFFRFKKLNYPFVSVVVAYDGQKVDKVIHNSYDQRIDYVMTEKKIYKIK